MKQHPGFQAVCLTCWVYIQMGWYQCKQEYHDSYKGPARCLKAAGEVVLGILGVKSSRCPAILRNPSRAVCCIGRHFPPLGNEHDFVFKGFRLADG